MNDHYRPSAPKLIMMRHGQSEWNRLNLFSGWVDIPLSEQGIQEAINGGKRIAHLPIDVIFVSSLVRAQTTAMLAMLHHSSRKVLCFQQELAPSRQGWGDIHSSAALAQVIPVFVAWELNERMYGELQGLNKQELKAQFGEEQVQLWRRSFRIAPPGGESLAMTAERSVSYFKKQIIPYLERGKNVFISAHGNSLRSIVMHLDNLNEDEVAHLEIATGEPLIYRWEEGNFYKELST